MAMPPVLTQRGRNGKKMIENYLVESKQLQGLILLMDIRRKWSEEETMILDFCQAMDLGVVVGLTKADKLSRSKWKSAVMQAEKQLGVPVYALSSLKKWGMSDILGHVLKNWIP
jgi:GTP-binding protein